jgi:hypothetical protein
MRRHMKAVLRLVKHWFDGGGQPREAPAIPTLPFDNTYAWLHAGFRRLMQDPVCATKPPYIWGVLQGAALAEVLGLPRVSMIEFGVGGGAGLLSMERAAELCEEMIGTQTLEVHLLHTISVRTSA